MAGILLPHQTHHQGVVVRSSLQKLCIGIGAFFLVVGVLGIVIPGLMGLHLSMANNLVHITSGLLALWCGYSPTYLRAYNFCIAFGAVYGLLGVAGFILGEPGYPGVGFTHADENLLRVIPNVLEFGTRDHIVHLVVSALLLIPAYYWKKDHARDSSETARVTVENQARLGRFKEEKGPTITSDSTSTTELSAADIDRIRKINPSDFNKHP